jgi:hypothetical protein
MLVLSPENGRKATQLWDPEEGRLVGEVGCREGRVIHSLHLSESPGGR